MSEYELLFEKIASLERRIEELEGRKLAASQPVCQWIKDKSMPGGKWFLPYCWGGSLSAGCAVDCKSLGVGGRVQESLIVTNTYQLHYPSSGGKAGKGRNKTSTVQVRRDNIIVKQFRYSLAMPIHKTYAIARAMEFIRQQGGNRGNQGP